MSEINQQALTYITVFVQITLLEMQSSMKQRQCSKLAVVRDNQKVYRATNF